MPPARCPCSRCTCGWRGTRCTSWTAANLAVVGEGRGAGPRPLAYSAMPWSGSGIRVRLGPRPPDVAGLIADVARPAGRGGFGAGQVAGLGPSTAVTPQVACPSRIAGAAKAAHAGAAAGAAQVAGPGAAQVAGASAGVGSAQPLRIVRRPVPGVAV